jgi:hypothetical protein
MPNVHMAAASLLHNTLIVALVAAGTWAVRLEGGFADVASEGCVFYSAASEVCGFSYRKKFRRSDWRRAR